MWTDPYAASWFSSRYSGQLKKAIRLHPARANASASALMVIQGSERKDINEFYAVISPRLSACAHHDRRHALRRRLRRDARTATFPNGHFNGRRTKTSRIATIVRRFATPRGRRPTFAVSRTRKQPAHHRGHGELHLEIIIDRLKREFKVEANTGAPQIGIARRSPRKPRRRQVLRQSGGKGQYACLHTVEPNEKARLEVIDELSAARFRRIYSGVISGIEKPSKARYAGYQVLTSKSKSWTARSMKLTRTNSRSAWRHFCLEDAFKKRADSAGADHEGDAPR